MFQPWLLLVLASATTSALARILQKKVMQSPNHDSMTLSFIFQFLAAIIFLVYSLVTRTFLIPDLTSVWLNVVAMMVIYALANIFSFLAFEYAEASEASILFTTSTVWSVITAVVFLNEKLTVWQLLGIIVMIFGIMVTYFEKSHWRFNRGHIFALLSSFLYGIAFTNDVFIMKHFQFVSSYMFMIFLLPSLTILLFRPKLLNTVKVYFIKPTVIRWLLGSILLYCFSSITYFTAYRVGGPASLISPIGQTSVVFTVILSVIFLKENKHLWQKLLGGLIAFAGVILLVSM